MSSTVNVGQWFGAFDGFRRGDSCGVVHSVRARVDRGDLPRDRGAMTFPMTFACVEAYAAARSCLGALADISDFDDSCRYERLLIDLDGIHGGDFPASFPMPGSQTGTLMVTTDRRGWQDLIRLPVVDLAADPGDADSLLVTDTSGRLMVINDGSDPQLVAGAPRLAFVDWPVVGLSADGNVYRSGDGAASWQELTSLKGRPEALDVTAERWYAATERGLNVSGDQGDTWSAVGGTQCRGSSSKRH